MVPLLFWSLCVLARLCNTNKCEFSSRGRHILHLPHPLHLFFFLTPTSCRSSPIYCSYAEVSVWVSCLRDSINSVLFTIFPRYRCKPSLRCLHSSLILYPISISQKQTPPKSCGKLQFTTRGQSFFNLLMCRKVQVAWP